MKEKEDRWVLEKAIAVILLLTILAIYGGEI